MYKSIKDVFDDELSHLKLDKRFSNEVFKFVKSFMTRNQEHIGFFGDALIGVHRIRFENEDRVEFFDDILDADYHSIRDNLYSLKTINPKFKVSSDPMNNTIMYLVHKLNKNKLMSPADNKDLQRYLVHLMHYRWICSLQTHYFPHQASPEIARAAFSALSNKFDLKTAGSWQKWIELRTEDILRSDGLHAVTIDKYTDDEAIVKMLNDMQGRIRGMYRNVAEVFHREYEGANRINSTSALMEGNDGEKVLKDQSNDFIAYRRYIAQTIPEPSSFIKKELVGIIESMRPNMPEDAFEQSLDYLSDNFQIRRNKQLEPLIDEIMLHALNFFADNKIRLNDLKQALNRLSSIYSASGTQDAALLAIKEKMGKELTYAIPSRKHSAIPSVRTGVMLYIVLRAITMKHYTA